MILSLSGEAPTVQSLVLDTIGSFPITNTDTTALLTDIMFLALCAYATFFTVTNPSKVQLGIEVILEKITSFIEQIVGNREAAWKIMPIVTTLIVYIMVSNLIMVLLPILSGITYEEQPMFRSNTNDINTTLALAFGLVLISHLYSMKVNGISYHLGKYFQFANIFKSFRKGLGLGFVAIIEGFVGLLDLISEFSKIISMSLRLFGNMFAAELLIFVLMKIFAIGLPLPMTFLSMFSGVIQAIVFGALVASTLGAVAIEAVERESVAKELV